MPIITDVLVRRILDSRGNATLEVDVGTEDGWGRAAAPSGASTGAHEVSAWPKGGVDAALDLGRTEVAATLAGLEVTDQRGLDATLRDLDGTPDLHRLGGNLTVAASLASAKAAAHGLDLPLYAYLGGSLPEGTPVLLGNVLGGGAHAVGGTDVQEFLTVPLGEDVTTAAIANARVHARVKALLRDRFPDQALGKGDEGAWVAPLADEEALELVHHAAGEVGDEAGIEIRVALDVAATELHDGDVYRYRDTTRSSEEQVEFIAGLVEDHDLVSVEDPLAEDDWDAWTELTRQVGDRCLVVGDDLFTTDPERVEEGVRRGAANAVLVKPNQVGTLTRTMETVRLAHREGLETIVSHRSGETEDATIAHLAVALSSLGIKTGTVGGERTAKLNELMRIAEEI